MGCSGQANRVSRSVALFFLSGLCLLKFHVRGGCVFPTEWAGSWFESGLQHPIRIAGDVMAGKGNCYLSDGEKFILQNRSEQCYRCVVIHQKHDNVLQYKETFCDSSYQSLTSLCSEINGDAQLHYMFRVNASPVTCPMKGSFSFVYNRGFGECRTPASTVDSCTEPWRLIFRYQACPDVPGTESTDEELVCLATWREGSLQYLIGRTERRLATTDEERYRCYVYNKLRNTYYVAKSGDATCLGLLSPYEGANTMALTKSVPLPMSRCVTGFVPYLLTGHRWLQLDGSRVYEFDTSDNVTLVEKDVMFGDHPKVRYQCLDEANGNTLHRQTYIVHVTLGCRTGYTVLTFVKRGNHVAEIHFGKLVEAATDTRDLLTNNNKYFKSVTVTTDSPESVQCPYKGQYATDPGASKSSAPDTKLILKDHSSDGNQASCNAELTIRVGCDSPHLLQIWHQCEPETQRQEFSCHATWNEDGISYLVATKDGTRSRHCFIYTGIESSVIKLKSTKTCSRNSAGEDPGSLSFNITQMSHCDSDSSASPRSITSSESVPFVLLMLESVKYLLMQLWAR